MKKIRFSQKNESKRNNAVIVEVRNFPDALTAISISKKQDAPILSTGNDISNSISSYISTFKRDMMYIVGGKNSVSENTQNKLIDLLKSNYQINGSINTKRVAFNSLRDNFNNNENCSLYWNQILTTRLNITTMLIIVKK